MSAKMNWDRVRKETQTRRSGSGWIGSDAVGDPTVCALRRGVYTERKRERLQTLPLFFFFRFLLL